MSRHLARSIILTTGLLLACGGGGGGSSSDGGGAGSAASEGPIQGFGSVIMNGARWNTDDAEFEIDGVPGDQDDLAVGMVVRVEGEKREDGSAHADRVIFDTRLRGPVRAIEDLGPDTRVLSVFEIRVIVSRSGTVLRDVDFDDLQTDMLIEASGLVDAQGDLEATWLRDRGPVRVGAEVKLYGAIEGLAGGSFLLRETEVFFDEDDADSDLQQQGLENGLEVRVEGLLLSGDDVDALEIESFRRHRKGDDDFGEVEIHGIVTNFVDLSRFAVAGRVVDASNAVIVPNDPSLVMDGVRVEAEGFVDDREVLIADKLKLRSNRVKIEAAVATDDDVDPVTRTVVLLGIPIHVPEEAEIEDDRDDEPGFDLGDIEAGDYLDIEGIASPDGNVVATELERDDADDEVRLEGPVDLVSPGIQVFTILGVEIPTDSATTFRVENADGFEETISEEEFYERVAPGTIVEARDREDGDPASFGVADEVEIEEDDLVEDGDDNDEDSDFDDRFDDSDDPVR